MLPISTSAVVGQRDDLGGTGLAEHDIAEVHGHRVECDHGHDAASQQHEAVQTAFGVADDRHAVGLVTDHAGGELIFQRAVGASRVDATPNTLNRRVPSPGLTRLSRHGRLPRTPCRRGRS